MRAYFRRADPFYDEQENHSLIGVANVFLESLFYDVKLQYAVPIINQKGEVCHSFHKPCLFAVHWKSAELVNVVGKAFPEHVPVTV